MGKFERKVSRRQNKGVVKVDPMAEMDGYVQRLRIAIEGTPTLGVVVREAMKMGGLPPTDVVVPLIHVEQTQWVKHLGIKPGDGSIHLAMDGYLSGAAFHWQDLAALNDTLAYVIDQERRAAMRDHMSKMSLAMVIHRNGRFDGFYYAIHDGKVLAERADVADATQHLGYDL